MASSLLLKIISQDLLKRNSRNTVLNVIRQSSKIRPRAPKPGSTKYRNIIQSSCESLGAKGFLRSYKPYTPNENATEKFKSICSEVLGNKYDENSPLSREDKFLLLSTCFKEFNHSVPNSALHTLVSVNDVLKFYQTPVSTTTPYDELKSQDLPPNLNVQHNYIRFDPKTDSKFKGVSPFPRSSTIITGLKSKEKYSSVIAESPYLDSEALTQEDYEKM